MSKPAWINVGAQTSVGTATVAAASDELTITSHGLADGDIVMVDSLTGGADGPLIEGAVYWVRNATADELQLSATKGGALVEFATDGGADVYEAIPQYNAQELRRVDSALMMHGSADRLGTRPGVRPGGSDAVSLSGTTWTVHNHSGLAYPGLTSLSGPYRYAQEEESDSLDPADGSNDRIDALDLQIQDEDEDASGQRRSRVVYTAGTPASSPSADPVATNAFRLATILVSAGGSPSPVLTYAAPFTVAAGGILPVRDDSELPSDGLYEGMGAWRQDTGALVVRYGGAWPIVAAPGGWVHIAAGDETGNFNIDLTDGGRFPALTFALIRVKFWGSLSELARLNIRVNDDSTAGLHRRTYEVRRLDNQTIIESAADDVTSWPVGLWSTGPNNIASATICNTDQNSALTMEGLGFRAASGTTLRHRLESNGDLASSRTISNLQVFPSSGSIDACRWWAEGYVAA